MVEKKGKEGEGGEKRKEYKYFLADVPMLTLFSIKVPSYVSIPCAFKMAQYNTMAF